MTGPTDDLSEWSAAIQSARECRDALLSIEEGAEGDKGEAARALFCALEQVFSLYAHHTNWTDSRMDWSGSGYPRLERSLPVNILPDDLAATVGGLLGFIGVGQMPKPIDDALIRQGRRRLNPSEKRDVRIAVAYISAVRTRLIADRAEVKAVREAFSVDRRTVQAWIKAYPVEDPSKHVIGDAEGLRTLMQRAGERYQQGGRAQAAIARRGAKPKV